MNVCDVNTTFYPVIGFRAKSSNCSMLLYPTLAIANAQTITITISSRHNAEKLAIITRNGPLSV